MNNGHCPFQPQSSFIETASNCVGLGRKALSAQGWQQLHFHHIVCCSSEKFKAWKVWQHSDAPGVEK